jgi:hypothetical protein
VRTILVEAAWAATRAKGTFLQAKYQRLEPIRITRVW